MSQHDYALADQAGLAFLADVNAALGAIVSQNSGATEPADTYPYMLWADTTSGWLKQRNAADTAWQMRLPLDAARDDVASAATLDLDAAAASWVRITGTTGITAVTLADGQVRHAVAGGAFTITNGASLIVPGSANYTTTAGDILHFYGEAAGVVRVGIIKGDGTAVVGVSELTGIVKDYVGTTAPSGYVLLSGRTIGSAASGATERANADTEALFTLLWNSMTDTEATVSTGRGASAAADFAANKTITLPDARGRSIVGKDNMGGTAANRITSDGSGITGTTLGTSGGAQTHTLTTAQMPAHVHYNNLGSVAGAASGVYRAGNTAYGPDGTSSAGSDGAHNNTQPTLILNKIVKL